MPFLPNPVPILVVKAIGYTIAGAVLRKSYGRGPHAILFAVTRIASGLILGVLSIWILAIVGQVDDGLGMFVWLLVTRLIVWSGLVWLMFERESLSLNRYALVVFLGIVWSFALDGILYLLERRYPDMMQIPWC